MKRIFLLLLLLPVFLVGCVPKKEKLPEIKEGGEEKMGVLTGKKVLMIIAPKDFRDEEFFKPRVALQATGAKIEVASKNIDEATGMLGGKAKIDLDISKVSVEDYDGVVFVGGTGATSYFNDAVVLKIAKEAVEKEKVVGAICIAPSILANAGVLKRKKVTSFSSEADNLKSKGASYTGEAVTADGKIITASGPEAAEEFGNKLVEVLSR